MLKRLLILSSLLTVMVITTVILLYDDYQTFLATPVKTDQTINFNITPGMTFNDINRQFKERGLIDNSRYFKFLARHGNKAHEIKSGEYEIHPGLMPKDVIDLFVSGKVIQHTFTLIEGWNINELLNAVKNNDVLIKTLNYDDTGNLMAELGCPETNPEGMFFPDTYHFPRGTTDKQFLLRAYQRLQDVLNEEWEQRAENLPYKTPYEALIMASIIEKETGLASERKTIAGVFVRRLDKNMKLQTDPTIIYAMGQQFDGNIRKKDLDIDSPYNTYRYKGLPPGPIALVGREAINAALHPEDGTALYFVAKGDGSHYFSDSLKEHNKAVAKYQLKASR